MSWQSSVVSEPQPIQGEHHDLIRADLCGRRHRLWRQPAINDLLAAEYNTVIVWSVHVTPDGTLILNNTQIVSGGVYQEAEPMDLPSRPAQLHKAGVEIIFSVGVCVRGPSNSSVPLFLRIQGAHAQTSRKASAGSAESTVSM